MSASYNYNPIPPRVWSRVQNQCTFIIPNNSYDSVYIPLTNQTVSLAQANYEDKLISKGNVLQYKGNSSRLTKSQKYTQIMKGFGPNRTKTFATQSQTYTNPNTSGLLRVNYTSLPYPNQLVGQPNNISGPYQYNVPNPFDCSINYLQDGGNLVCGTYANQCSGEIIKTGATSATICNPSSASNVPGTSILCWNKKVQTWFPKPRYFMNNSTDKWPQGYKGFVSAVTPDPPTDLIVQYVIGDDFTILSWNINSNNCLPVSNFNIYQNNKYIKSVPYDTTTTTLTNIPNCSELSYYVTSVSNKSESSPSNIETIETYYIQYPIITSVSAQGNEATINWSKPSSCAEVSYYNIYQDSSILMSGISSNIYSMLIQDLSACTDYTFNVSYFDSLFNIESPLSNTVIVTQVPEPPTFTNAIPGNNSVTMIWTAPLVTCQPISYNAYFSDSLLIQPNITSPYVLSGLTNGQTYSFYLKSYSSLNNMYSSASIILSATLTVPKPPTNPLASITSPSSATISWREPLGIQNPPITYTIQYSTDGGINYTICVQNIPYVSQGSSRSYIVQNLPSGIPLLFQILSVNTYNISASSQATNSITLPYAISITASNYNTSLSDFSGNSSSGIIVFTNDGSFIINSLLNDVSINILCIGPGVGAGKGGSSSVGTGAYGGGGGGGGGGGFALGYINNTLYNYNGSNFTVQVGQGSPSSVIPSYVSLNGNQIVTGYNGGVGIAGNKCTLSDTNPSGGNGGGGGGGGVNGTYAVSSQIIFGGYGGKGQNGQGGATGQLTGGSANPDTFTINNSKNLTLYFGGGGGGGSLTSGINGQGGSYGGGTGGYGPNSSGNRSGSQGANGYFNTSANNWTWYLGTGGGGGSGSDGTSGYDSGPGTSGGVIIYWST